MAKADQGSILGVLRIGDYGKDSGGRSVISAWGNSRMTVVPTPGVLSSCIMPWWLSIICLQIARPSPVPRSLGAIERLKDPRQDLGRHAHACIKAQSHLLVCGPTGGNSEGTTAWHGMPGIDEHIEEHLFELLSSAADAGELGRYVQPDCNALVLETCL